jgi:CRISPR/Cas system-associated exonuclease Cas4 (RecB family)
MKTIRASEIGAYLYCQRAWWYQRQGYQNENQEALAGGTEIHRRHGRSVLVSSTLRLIAYILLFLGLASLLVYLLSLIL